MVRSSWVGRRWLEFTKGYSGYLVFALNFSVFVTIVYEFIAKDIYEEIPLFAFAIVMVSIILPIAMLIGHMHFIKQHPIEQDVIYKNNPYTFRFYDKSRDIILAKAQITTLELLKKNATSTEIEKCNSSIKQLQQLVDGEDSRSII